MQRARLRWVFTSGLCAAALGCSSPTASLFEGGHGGGSGSSSGATTATASTTSSTSITTSTSTASASSSTSSGGESGIPCGSATCVADGLHACCWDGWDTNTGAQATCVFGVAGSDGCNTYASAGGYETRIVCSSNAQCGQQVCCGHRITASVTYYDAVTCEEACTYPDLVMCQPGDTCAPAVTTTGTVPTTCGASTLLPPGYDVCRTD